MDDPWLAAAALWFGLGGLAKCLVASLEAMQRWNKKKAKIVRLPRYSCILLQLRIEIRIVWFTKEMPCLKVPCLFHVISARNKSIKISKYCFLIGRHSNLYVADMTNYYSDIIFF